MEKKYTTKQIIEMYKVINNFNDYKQLYSITGNANDQEIYSGTFLRIVKNLKTKVPNKIIQEIVISLSTFP